MKLRRLTKSGIDQFRAFLEEARENPRKQVPQQLLQDGSHTTVVEPEIEIESKEFGTRADAANYFHSKFCILNSNELNSDIGLWSWLSLFYFDQVCPLINGKRTVRNDYTYIFEPRNMRHFYRHLLYIAWRVENLAGQHSRLYLWSTVNVMDKVTSEVMKRLFLTRIPCIFEVLDRIYWDDSAQRPIQGIVGSKTTAGDLTHRLPTRLRQLEKTYDLYSLNADQLLELLGNEFQFATKSK